MVTRGCGRHIAAFLGVYFSKAQCVPFQYGWKIYCVSAPAMPVHTCIFITVFLEISTPRPDLGRSQKCEILDTTTGKETQFFSQH